MHKLNRLSSPMHLFEDYLNDTDNVRIQKIENIKNEKLPKSPYSIGSVSEIERKVQHMEDQINGVTTNVQWDLSDSDDAEENKEILDSSNSNRFKEKKELDRFAGVFSVVSATSFNKPLRVKKIAKVSLNSKSNVQQKESEKTVLKLIELWKYREMVDCHIPSLPHAVSVSFILKRVVKAQRTSYVPLYKQFIEKWLFCTEIEVVLKSLFWYFFLSHYGNEFNRVDLPKLFAQAAYNYTLFLYKICEEKKHKNQFQKILPNILSQALYAMLSECFPDSWSQFNGNFIDDVTFIVFLWITGIRPTKGLWKSWNNEELKPTEQKKKEKAVEDQIKMGIKIFEDGAESKEHTVQKEKEIAKEEPLPIGHCNSSRSVLLNISGRSPLVQYFLLTHNVNLNKGKNYLIRHKEYIPIELTDDSITYDMIIQESKQSLRDRVNSYKKFQQRSAQTMHQSKQRQIVDEEMDEKNLNRLLDNNREVHRLCNLLVYEYLRDKDSVSFKVDHEIKKSIAQMGKIP